MAKNRDPKKQRLGYGFQVGKHEILLPDTVALRAGLERKVNKSLNPLWAKLQRAFRNYSESKSRKKSFYQKETAFLNFHEANSAYLRSKVFFVYLYPGIIELGKNDLASFALSTIVNHLPSGWRRYDPLDDFFSQRKDYKKEWFRLKYSLNGGVQEEFISDIREKFAELDGQLEENKQISGRITLDAINLGELKSRQINLYINSVMSALKTKSEIFLSVFTHLQRVRKTVAESLLDKGFLRQLESFEVFVKNSLNETNSEINRWVVYRGSFVQRRGPKHD